MKASGSYNNWKLFEITETDLKKGIVGYEKSDIVAFRPDEDYFQLGYEEWCAGSVREMKEFIDSDIADHDKKKRIVKHEEMER